MYDVASVCGGIDSDGTTAAMIRMWMMLVERQEGVFDASKICFYGQPLRIDDVASPFRGRRLDGINDVCPFAECLLG